MKMVKEKDKRKREIDRRLSLLALSAEQAEALDNCPDDTDFAMFLDSDPLAPENETIRNHMSLCESCYQRWLILSEDLSGAAETRGGPTQSIIKPRLLATIGSACALAAGVMLYISIDYKPMLKQDMQEVRIEQDSFSQPGDQSFSGDQEAVLSDSVQTKSPVKVKRSVAIVSDVSNEMHQPEPNVSSVPAQMGMMKNEAKATGAEMASGTVQEDMQADMRADKQEVRTEQDLFSQPGDQSFSGDQEAVLSDSVQTKPPVKEKRSVANVSGVSNEMHQPEPNVSSMSQQMPMMKKEAKVTGAEMAPGSVQEGMQVMGGQQEHDTAALAKSSADQMGNETDRYQDFLTLISAFCSDTEEKNAVTQFETLVKRGRDLMKSDDRMDFDQKAVVEQIVILLEKEDLDKGIDRKKLCERLKEPAGLKETDR